jgi:hypothetical protein
MQFYFEVIDGRLYRLEGIDRRLGRQAYPQLFMVVDPRVSPPCGMIDSS